MEFKMKKFWLVLVLLVAFAVSSVWAAEIWGATNKITVNPIQKENTVADIWGATNKMTVNPTIQKGNTATVTIYFTNERPMAACGLFLQPDGLKLISTPGAAFQESPVKDWGIIVAEKLSNQNVISIGAAAIGLDNKEVEPGTHVLVTLEFEVTGPNPKLEVTKVVRAGGDEGEAEMVDNEAKEMPFEIEIGKFTDAPDVPAEPKTESAIPKEFALNGNYPNPFNPSTNISFALPVESRVKIIIYNVLGQVVKTFDENYPAGYHIITWDGTNNRGEAVASSIYFYQFMAGSFSAKNKMVLSK